MNKFTGSNFNDFLEEDGILEEVCAKTQFGDMLLKVQRAPIQINKNGKPVAVVVSVDEYKSIEALKLRLLQSKAAKAKDDICNGNMVDGESFFDELESGKHD